MARNEELPPQFLAPAWEPERSEFLVLWHGTTDVSRQAIEKKIELSRCAVDTDFGRGFYLTTLERQARFWAWKLVDLRRMKNPAAPDLRPVVLRFRVRRFTLPGKVKSPRHKGLDGLRRLAFVRANHDSDDFWSLVQHCRASVPSEPTAKRPAVVHNHKRGPNGRGWYDVVSGPVAAFWEQRVAMIDADQYSFHTPAAVAVLQDLIVAGRNREDAESYLWEYAS